MIILTNAVFRNKIKLDSTAGNIPAAKKIQKSFELLRGEAKITRATNAPR